MFMGFTLHFYIIFGTNLLTGGPARIAVFFCLFQCFEGKEYQTESKQNETFGNVIFGTNVIRMTCSGSQTINKEATRQGGTPAPLGAPHPRGPLMGPPTYFFLLYIPTYPKNIQGASKNNLHRRNLLYPRDPILEPSSVGIDHGGLLHQHHSPSDEL